MDGWLQVLQYSGQWIGIKGTAETSTLRLGRFFNIPPHVLLTLNALLGQEQTVIDVNWYLS